MNEAGHQQRALDIEGAIQILGDPAAKPSICPVLIESYWGAAFHWIVVGCMRKHAWHTDSHGGLSKRLTQLGEPTVAAAWDRLETLRTGGWYTYQAGVNQVAEAKQRWQEIRIWATT